MQERQAFQTVTSATHTEAINGLTTWYRGVFRRLRATLTRFHPEQAAALFANLEVSAEADVSLVAKIFLDRLEALEGDQAAKGSRRSSHAVVKMLAERGFGPHEIRSVRKLIEVADAPATEAPDLAVEDSAAKREVRLGLLRELRSWYDDWSETARAVLVRRDHAIRVGIAHRKARKAPAVPVVVEDPSAPALPSGHAPIALLPAASKANEAA